jgi:L-amino acid N-acyltransferase YncA
MSALLRTAAEGDPPPADGSVAVWPSPPGPADAVLAFTTCHVVAADIDPSWVRSQLPSEDPGAPMRPAFLSRLGQQLGARPGMVDVVLAGRATAAQVPPTLDEVAPDDEPRRLARARRYRRDLRCFRDRRGGIVVLGTGLAGRTEVSIEIDEHARGSGLGAALARSALHLAPTSQPLFAQVSPGNVASLRCFLAAGYRPIGAEVLFLRGQR